ncbi:MAG: methyl-accepting chemotaxis protein [Desulfobacterales bacterium]|nr:methyl-accepting chemotaxis protein [Desulfobacterales bacterium]
MIGSLQKSRLGISAKTSFVSGVIVFILLALATLVLIKFQYHLISFIIGEHETIINNALDNQVLSQKEKLHERFQVIGEITSGVVSSFIFNIDAEGCQTVLKSYMKLEEIVAIIVIDEQKQPFSAAWKEKNKVNTGSSIENKRLLLNMLHKMFDVKNDQTKIGSIEIYYTDNTLNEELKQSKEDANAQKEEFKSNIESQVNTASFYQIIGVLIVIFVLAIAISLCMRTVAIRPLNKVISGLKDIAQGDGDLTRRLDIKTKDEIGELAYFFDMFVEKLQHMILEVANDSEQLKQASKSLSQLSEILKTSSNQVNHSSNSVSTAAEEMSNSMRSIAAAIEQTSTTLELVVKSTDNMTSRIKEISKSSQKASSITTDAVQKAEETMRKVEELGNAAQQINKVTETITEISEQTNLLALNASIEAARAGDAGRGFAVVANEIKELASQTAKATRGIRTNIEGIRDSISKTVAEIVEVSKVINTVNDIVTIITQSVQDQMAITDEIASNLTEGSKGIHEGNRNVAQCSSVSSEIAGDISKVNASANELDINSSQVNQNAEELLELATHLSKLVSRFKI